MYKSKLKFIIILLISISFFTSCKKNNIYPDGKTSFNDNWKFAPIGVTKVTKRISSSEIITKVILSDSTKTFKNCEKSNFDDSKWQTLNVPHDMSIVGPFEKDNASLGSGAWLPNGSCVYRKHFTVSTKNKDKLFEIYFDGVYRNSEVYLNGKLLGKRPFGYIAFFYDMTPYINFGGENVLTVKVDNTRQPGARWYTGTGIYRNVTLKVSDKLYIPTWGNYIVSDKYDSKYGYININTTVSNKFDKKQNYTLKYTIYSPKDNIVVLQNSNDYVIEPNKNNINQTKLKISNPLLWNTENPNLYTVKTEIIQNKKTIYNESSKIGIRTIVFSGQKGFILNGKKVTMKGVCLHNCGGPLGAAVEKRTIERQIDLLKSMGTNAIRTSHNPFSSVFLDICDEKGIIVMNEMFDVWTTPKPKPGHHMVQVDYYHKEFKKWSSRDLRDFVLRDRNHASVAMWSIGNEIVQMMQKAGIPIQKRLEEVVHTNDYRPVTNAVYGYAWNQWPNEKAVIQNDILGYNYITTQGMDKENKIHSNKPKVVTECASAQTFYPRGTYLFGKDKDKWFEQFNYEDNKNRERMDSQTGDSHALIKTRGLDAWRAILDHPNLVGQFIWTGFDYLGEIGPYDFPANTSNFAPFDLIGVKKSSYYFYKSQWTTIPTVHIIPSWNFQGHEGEKLPILSYTNGDKVELFLNGKSMGIRYNDLKAVEYQEWMVEYQPGTLIAKAYKNNIPYATDTVWTSTDSKEIKLEPYNTEMKAGGHDLIYVTCSILDKAGHPAVNAKDMLDFKITGPATIAGMGNGDNLCIEPFQGNGINAKTGKHSAFHGKTLIILKSTNESGKITLNVSGNNLKNNSIKLHSF